MRRVLVATGVLGLGTVLTFAAAGLAASLFPSGALVNAGYNPNPRLDLRGPLVDPAWGGQVVAVDDLSMGVSVNVDGAATRP